MIDLYYVARDPEGHYWRVFREIPLPDGWERVPTTNRRFYDQDGLLSGAGTMLKRYFPS